MLLITPPVPFNPGPCAGDQEEFKASHETPRTNTPTKSLAKVLATPIRSNKRVMPKAFIIPSREATIEDETTQIQDA